MRSLNIAVIGSGISGLSAAWLLDKKHNVTLFEASPRLGGHTNTVVMDIEGTPVPVDTGFICFNSAAYPNLVALFDYLDVPVHNTDMSFAASMRGGEYEYSGGTYFGLFGQPSNLFKPTHWRMIGDILRFFKHAPQMLEDLKDDETLGHFLKRHGYSGAFTDNHLLPMAAAIWSSKRRSMLDYPARSFILFFQNHGLLQVEGRPRWGTVQGGSQVYIDKLLEDSNIAFHTSSPVSQVQRGDNGVRFTTPLGSHSFDHVVIASHADQALTMLADASPEEQKLLGAFGYTNNHAVLHRDPRYMPKRRLTWASWNYMELTRDAGSTGNMCLTYWMNSLQNLPTREQVFVTLNPPENAPIARIAGRYDYAHPVFNTTAMVAQRRLWSLQGVNRTWYCGAHFGAGFHEDGLQSGLAVAEQLGGGRRPWSVQNESGRIVLDPDRDVHEAAE